MNPLPKVKISRADEFFKALNQYEDVMDTWKGELYLENHQGTLTSQANLKKAHRKFEQKLKTVETLLVQFKTSHNYQETLDDVWKEHLLYEFHDILPGSSIKRVYDEALSRYKDLNRILDDLLEDATNVSISKDFSIDSMPYNSNIFDATIRRKANQSYVDFKIKALSNKILETKVHHYENIVEELSFDLNDYSITFSKENGYIESLMNNHNSKELALDHQLNKLSVYQDFGDAWNIKDHYREQIAATMQLTSRVCKKYGPIYEIIQTYEFKSSSLKEIIILDTFSNKIEFNHEVDWQDVGYMLRTNFPLDILSDTAMFDIQFGEIERPRTTRDLIEKAKFEVCGHHWVSIFDGFQGASLINDSKYGFHVQHNAFDMNLLRSTNYPAVSGDIGKTSYQYALVLHESNHIDAHIDELGMQMNTFYPIFAKELEVNELFKISSKDIECSAIKESSDKKAIIVRLYEKHGKQVDTKVIWNQLPVKICETNLIEKDEVEVTNDSINFKPYEIKTFKVYMN
ncbi:hypothetical protein KHQ89_05905 [Mycoplasmatota bacterium]|nr:hypothetical protein KHQ89_05905 [Mycoplasmatota bacterium]